MREIIFRGKRKDNGEWVQGYLFVIWEKAYILWGTTNGIPDMIEVIPETVGQYTGLKDKNGTKIFEWDIVRFWDVNVGYSWDAVVVFGNPNGSYSWGWQLRPLTRCKGILDILLWVEMEEGGVFCKVIGNIHDNPELLKGETNE